MAENTEHKSEGGRLNLRALLTGSFLTNPKWAKNWPFILYLSLLALAMIASSHNAERKVHRISDLRNQVKELSSQYIEIHAQLMKESMESKVVARAEEQLKLYKAETPPRRITIKEEEE